MNLARWTLQSVIAAAFAIGWASPALADPPMRMALHDHIAPANLTIPSPVMLPAVIMPLHAPRTVSGPSVAVPDASLAAPIAAGATASPAHGLETMSAAEMIQKIGTLQFLSATIIPARREVVPVGDSSTITQITPSLRIQPTFVGKTYGLTAIASF